MVDGDRREVVDDFGRFIATDTRLRIEALGIAFHEEHAEAVVAGFVELFRLVIGQAQIRLDVATALFFHFAAIASFARLCQDVLSHGDDAFGVIHAKAWDLCQFERIDASDVFQAIVSECK